MTEGKNGGIAGEIGGLTDLWWRVSDELARIGRRLKELPEGSDGAKRSAVEVAARAIVSTRLASAFDQEWVDENWHKFADEARNVLLAIREPTKGMVARGNMKLDGDDAEFVWRAMIDAALAEVSQ